MASSASQSEVDCTCPVCCDIFTDPVLLLCGHSFCKDCLQQWWRQSRLQTCPVCKEIFPMAQPPRNLALRNLSDTLRRERSQRANSGSEEMCSLHGERLKLFCQDDQQLICLICRDSQKHKKHNCFPINEAAEAYRLQAQQTEKTIKEEFLKLYQFLRAEEAARIDAVRKEATLKNEAVNIRIINLTAEISSLEDRIRTTKREMMAEDISFMLNVRSTMKRSQCNLPDPETPSGALIDEAKHLGNLLFTVWRKMKDIIQYTPVTLDPNTGDPLLIISEHMTRSTQNKTKPLPRNPERLQTWDVLGSEGFGSGKHSWDVEVGLDCWAVGVAARTKNPKGFWGILRHAADVLLEHIQQDYDRIDFKGTEPQKIRVHLDYDRGILSFFDLGRKRPVHTIKYTFTKTVFPYFRGNVKILPAVVSVKIRT
ncbi:zinc-binding protein A33-like isoform X4 [Epinephelus fuscoguttatus]|uniref:zinc-binding protein A33-like isoform X4 n=1 Tax=Epinephelus fuscoguttatus TaxID=293821 RepID=UPI0020D13C0A|nr:zinc-binding protein A33-like isoform X4 [Epinephelus fuscoguttatus]